MHSREQFHSPQAQVLDGREIAHLLQVHGSPRTETRYGTINGGEGHMTCRRVPVTLPYSGTLAVPTDVRADDCRDLSGTPMSAMGDIG